MKLLILCLMFANSLQAQAPRTWQTHCVTCHAERLELRGRKLTAAKIQRAIRQGVPGTSMVAWRYRLSAAELRSLERWVLSLQ